MYCGRRRVRFPSFALSRSRFASITGWRATASWMAVSFVSTISFVDLSKRPRRNSFSGSFVPA